MLLELLQYIYDKTKLRAIHLINTGTAQRYSESRFRWFEGKFILPSKIDSKLAESRQNRTDEQSPTTRTGEAYRRSSRSRTGSVTLLYYYIMTGSY